MTAETALVKYVNTNDANGYYKALGLSPGATREEIKAAYYKLAYKLHPDRNPDNEEAEGLFKFVAQVASVLLNPQSKVDYDSVGSDSLYLGDMEREELARSGLFRSVSEKPVRRGYVQHWACATSSGFSPGQDTDAWVNFCREVSPAVGYRGRVRVAVLETGQHAGVATAGPDSFLVFQKGVEPNRLHALCAMIEWQNHLLKQRAQAQD